jgi:hypothetical protein
VPTETLSRPFTDRERGELERVLQGVPNRLGRAKIGLANTFLLWAASLLAAIVVWLIFAAIAKAASGLSIGWGSPYRAEVVAWSALGCAALSAVCNYRWMKGLKNPTVTIQADLSGGIVSEEHYHFFEVKRLQEPEHGGLIYFLRSSNGKAYVLYDHESQDLGARGEEPLRSSFSPRAELVTIRAPSSRLVLSSQFSGPLLSLPEPTDLLVAPSAWPEQDEYCPVPWERLEEHFGKLARAQA